ncbi:MAG: flagellar biosynthetic protein FliR [Pseudomonadota bacterium]
MEEALAFIFQTTEEGVFIAGGIFARVGAMTFLLPGLGERAISIRVRLAASLAITFLLGPLIAPLIPESPRTPLALAFMLGAEATTGLILGFAFRCLIFALQTAGMIASQSISLAQMFGAGVAPEPEPTIATLLSLGGITLMMMAGLHVHAIATLVAFYEIFPFGEFALSASVAEWATERVAQTFALGVTLAAPFVAIGFAYNLALGALNRAMPQLLVALVGVPFIVWIGMVVLYHTMPEIYATWSGSMGRILVDPLMDLR